MSVTFTAAHVAGSAFIISCVCPAAKAAAFPYATYDAAQAAYLAEPLLVELPGCEYPGRCRPFILSLDPAGDDIIDCGRPAGYLQTRLTELHALAVWCAGQGRAVSWA